MTRCIENLNQPSKPPIRRILSPRLFCQLRARLASQTLHPLFTRFRRKALKHGSSIFGAALRTLGVLSGRFAGNGCEPSAFVPLLIFRNAKETCSGQLRQTDKCHRPNEKRHFKRSAHFHIMVRPRRFERPTPAFGGQYSIQLSYGRVGGEFYL